MFLILHILNTIVNTSIMPRKDWLNMVETYFLKTLSTIKIERIYYRSRLLQEVKKN